MEWIADGKQMKVEDSWQPGPGTPSQMLEKYNMWSSRGAGTT